MEHPVGAAGVAVLKFEFAQSPINILGTVKKFEGVEPGSGLVGGFWMFSLNFLRTELSRGAVWGLPPQKNKKYPNARVQISSTSPNGDFSSHAPEVFRTPTSISWGQLHFTKKVGFEPPEDVWGSESAAADPGVP